jgi:eukaryotic-like serine/threonine-protein kinase
VYQAQDVRLQRIAAVKILRAQLASDPSAIARVMREAANGARIRNQHVVDVSDYGETDDGRPYLAMEFIPGESLRALLEREGRLDPRRAASLLRQIASGLDAAHRLGIVHRDMKPDNVLVYNGEGNSELVKVVDFGIARAIRDESQHLTKTGFITGTCEFMSPEQVTGLALDHRSDIYALGLVAFMMLTGSLPFTGDTPELAMLVRLRESPRRLDEVVPSVPWPRGLQDALDRALALEAGSRFDSAGEFARAVEDSVAWSPPSTGLDAPAGRARWKTPAVAAGTIAIVAVAVVWWYNSPRPDGHVVSPLPVTTIAPSTIPQETGEVEAAPPPSPATPPAEIAPPQERHPTLPEKPQVQRERAKSRQSPSHPATGAAVEELERYRQVLRPELTADSARQVIGSLENLLPRLTTKRDSVDADIYRAEAYALAGETEKACAILESARPYANSLQRQKMELWVGEGLCQSPGWKSS